MSLSSAAAKEEKSSPVMDEEDEYAVVGGELADALGVPEKKREGFLEALHAFVQLCSEEGK